MSDYDDIQRRLGRLPESFEAGPELKARSMAAMRVALGPELGPELAPVSLGTRLARVRRRLAVGASAMAVTTMPLAAAASQSALPGETLYPVKRAVEVVVSPIAPDLAAHHRVEELAELVTRGADEVDISEAVSAAESRLDDLDGDDPARQQFTEIIAGLRPESPVVATVSPEPTAPPAPSDDDDRSDDESEEMVSREPIDLLDHDLKVVAHQHEYGDDDSADETITPNDEDDASHHDDSDDEADQKDGDQKDGDNKGDNKGDDAGGDQGGKSGDEKGSS